MCMKKIVIVFLHFYIVAEFKDKKTQAVNFCSQPVFFFIIPEQERLQGKHLHKHRIQYMYRHR